jgi:hypothetical protein
MINLTYNKMFNTKKGVLKSNFGSHHFSQNYTRGVEAALLNAPCKYVGVPRRCSISANTIVRPSTKVQ